MKIEDGRPSTSPTDLANFLACRHKIGLDWRAALGELARPTWRDPFVDVLAERGKAHERSYIEALGAAGRSIEDLTDVPIEVAEFRLAAAMRAGTDVIVQAPLSRDGWFGYADILMRVDRPSALGRWSYEVHDTKLARETRGGAILQLSVYTEIVGALQQQLPEFFHVVTPDRVDSFRVDDFTAFYRLVKAEFLSFVADTEAGADRRRATYPDPCHHCDVCRWWQRCNAERRQDDHLSFVAGLGRVQATELKEREVSTLGALAEVPVPIAFTPRRGVKETYERLREQARLQVEQRTLGKPVFEVLPVRPETGLCLLPEPSPGDLFLDLEGDPFAREGGREYLFGLGRIGRDGAFTYQSWWAFTDDAERQAFDAALSEIVAAIEAYPSAHVYHYAPYEPSAFRRLMGRHAWREPDVDTLLRGSRFVDLYAVVRQSVRAGVESYSIKQMEPFYQFRREVDLPYAGDQRRLVEHALERGDTAGITPDIKTAVEGYNRDDCRSTHALRQWLEKLRVAAIAGGAEIRRPDLRMGEASEKVNLRDRWSAGLRTKLLDGLPPATMRTPDQQARWLIAHLADWFRREERVAWGEYHRLREKSDEELEDEPLALVGLMLRERVFAPPTSGRARNGIDRYDYPAQENDLRVGDQVKLKNDESFGTISAIDKALRTVDIKKPIAQTDVHPSTIIALTVISAPEQEQSVYRAANLVAMVGLDDNRGDPLVNDLLLSRPPRLRFGRFAPKVDEDATDFAIRTVRNLDESVLAIQGPPGAGKTFTGGRMIAALLAEGKNVGVVATSHAVIRKLLVDAAAEAARLQIPIAMAHKIGEGDSLNDGKDEVKEFESNDAARVWLRDEGAGVLGGTAWMWSRQDFAKSVDVLFVDEAGQMSLANVIAVAQAARNLVLLGDPQQLEQPQRGTHPDGVDVSALEHMIGSHKTIAVDRGIFLPVTWRLAPAVSAFTSEVFYEGKLKSRPTLERQRLIDAGRFDGAGLWLVEVTHAGCRSASTEEAEAVDAIVRELLAPGVSWINEQGARRPLTANDILVVAPYNAHVNRLRDVIGVPVRVGTVDKFQGQEAAVAIYSMGTSVPEDAPRGMEFLYSLNRLNVATSRARCACIVVASPRLFEPACDTPRQMRLANALCRYREMATILTAQVDAQGQS